MRSPLMLPLISLLALLPAAAAAPADAPPGPLAEKMTVEQQLADFDVMRDALEEAHTGLYRYTPKAQLDAAFAAARARLSRPVTKLELWVTLNQAVAAIRCGHTSVDPDDALADAIRAQPLFPLLLHAEGGSAVVQFNGTADNQSIRPGMRILSVNGHAMADLLPRFVALMSVDGDNRTGALAHLPKLFPIFYFAAVERTDRFVVEAADESGKTVTATLAGVKGIDPSKNTNPVNTPVLAAVAKRDWGSGNLSLRFLKDPDVAEIRMRYFVGDDFPKWMEQTFQTVRDKGTKALILDLRGNGGGNDEYGALLVSCLTDKPFRYFDHIDIKNI
jgi:hypothetical protein